MPPQPYPWVTRVTIKEKQIVLTVQADQFRTGESLEISGYATQTSGAFAVFNVIQAVPKANPDETITMYVTASPSQPFMKGQPVTVVLRAGPVWVSVLEEPPTGPAAGSPSVTAHPPAEEGTTWSVRTSAAYAEPSSGADDNHTSTGSEDSF
jgi:hypothetical protein